MTGLQYPRTFTIRVLQQSKSTDVQNNADSIGTVI